MRFNNRERAVIHGTMSDLDGKSVIVVGVTVVGYGCGSHFYHIKQENGNVFDNDGEKWETIAVTESCLISELKHDAD